MQDATNIRAATRHTPGYYKGRCSRVQAIGLRLWGFRVFDLGFSVLAFFGLGPQSSVKTFLSP